MICLIPGFLHRYTLSKNVELYAEEVNLDASGRHLG
jgi:hypothetical protein